MSVLRFGFCLLLGLSVSWLVVLFGKYVIMPFSYGDGVSVGLFY